MSGARCKVCNKGITHKRTLEFIAYWSINGEHIAVYLCNSPKCHEVFNE